MLVSSASPGRSETPPGQGAETRGRAGRRAGLLHPAPAAPAARPPRPHSVSGPVSLTAKLGAAKARAADLQLRATKTGSALSRPSARAPSRTSIRPTPCSQSANQRVAPALSPPSRGGCGPRGASTAGRGCSRGGDLRGMSPSPRALLHASATSYRGFLPPDFVSCRSRVILPPVFQKVIWIFL